MKGQENWIWFGVVLHGYTPDLDKSIEYGRLGKHFGLPPNDTPPTYKSIVNSKGDFIVLDDVLSRSNANGKPVNENDTVVQITNAYFDFAVNKLRRLPSETFESWRNSGLTWAPPTAR
jgi:hypothetical protein